jgi:hypothetical protein
MNDPDKLMRRNWRICKYFGLMMLSLITSTVVIYTIFSHDDIKNAHPSKLLAAMSLCELVTCWQVFIWTMGAGHVACYWKVAQGYGITYTFLYNIVQMFYKPLEFEWTQQEDIKDFHPVLDVSKANQQFYEMFQIASYCLNGCLCVDLFLTFKNPFSPSGRRLKFYFIFTGIVVAFVTITTINQSTFLLSPL